jgi:hypothetical protein
VLVAEVRKRLTVSKRATQTFYMERFTLTKLNEVECKEHYHIKLLEGYAALEILHDDVVINRTSGSIRENIKIESLCYYELKK